MSEAEVHWRNFLTGLKERGVGIPDLITSDAHSGLKATLKACFNATPWQRCQFHLQQNAQAHITKQELKNPIADQIRTIFNSPDFAHAEEATKGFVTRWETQQAKVAS